MTDLAVLLGQGSANTWLYVPSALLLGALHGLEPGHSKTMMAAFIVAVRGTLAQAVLLGLSATLSHTLVVWIIALGGLYFGQRWNAATSEPYLQIASAVIMALVAVWMIWRTWSFRQGCHAHHHDDHDHKHEHPHHEAYQDEHERAHALDIEKRFANRQVTTTQIVIFGLTGGLIPCPASITVLLLCLQFKQITLGATLVLCFSVGLALTMVASGVLAALSVKHVASRWSGFGALARHAPYVSGALILVVSLVLGISGWRQLT